MEETISAKDFQKLLSSGSFSVSGNRIVIRGNEKNPYAIINASTGKISKDKEHRGLTEFIFRIKPIPAPRTTGRMSFLLTKPVDQWPKKMQAKAKILHRYVDYKDNIRQKALMFGLNDLPSIIETLEFHFEMPKRWSERKKKGMVHTLHKNRPDLDNLLKAFQDALCTEDSHIAYIKNGLGKFWNHESFIKLILYV